jgi:hypothetical protein
LRLAASAAVRQGGALPEPEVKSYEYRDMKPLFNKDAPTD